MTALQPLRYQDLLSIERRQRTSWITVLGLSLLFGVATFLATIPGGGLWVVAGLAVALAAIVAWWLRMRAEGKRFNNYDPKKSEVELSRTSNSSPEQQRLIFLQIVVLAAVFGGRLFHLADYPLIAGVAVTILSSVVLATAKTLPPKFQPVTKLTNADPHLELTKDRHWMLAFLYTHRIVPGGQQWRNDALAEAAQAYHFPALSLRKTLKSLQSQGMVAMVKELRSTDGSLQWVTLTEEGTTAAARIIQASR